MKRRLLPFLREARALVAPHLLLLPLCALVLAPVAYLVQQALDDGRGGVTFDAFSRLFLGQEPAARQLLNSLVVALVVSVVAVVCATPAAYALARDRFPWRSVFRAAIAFIAVAPITFLLVPGFLLAGALRLRDSLVALVLLELATVLPVALWLLERAFVRQTPELEESARLSGAPPALIFRQIALPLARPAILSVWALAFALAWNEWVAASVLLTSPARQTLPVSLVTAAQAGGPLWARFAAGALLLGVPSLALLLSAQPVLGRLLAGAPGAAGEGARPAGR